MHHIHGKPTETGTLKISARVTFDKDHDTGAIGMTIAQAEVNVNLPIEGAPKNTVATISAIMGGGIQIDDRRTGKTWQFSALDIWTAYTTMLNENLEAQEEEPGEGENE